MDHQLYVKFWQLQDAFSKPNSCYDRLAWKAFQRVLLPSLPVNSLDRMDWQNMNDVVSVLQSYKLEPPQEQAKAAKDVRPFLATAISPWHRLDKASFQDAKRPQKTGDYFAKYLTSPKVGWDREFDHLLSF